MRQDGPDGYWVSATIGRCSGCTRLGSFLVRVATDHPDVVAIRQVLSTAPERTLYRQFGFDRLAAPERWMERQSARRSAPATE